MNPRITWIVAAALAVPFLPSDSRDAPAVLERGEPAADAADLESLRCDRSLRPGEAASSEPNGFRPLAAIAFGPPASPGAPDGARASASAADWGLSVERPTFRTLSHPTAPRSPPFVAEARYPVGFGDGRTPAWAERDVSADGATRLYVCYWFRLSENWQGHESGVNKIGFVWIGERPKVAVTAFGSGPGGLVPQLRLQDLPSEIRSARNLEPNLGGAVVQRGRWHRWEVVVVANRPGIPDGEARWWIDGRPAGAYDDIAYVAPGEPPTWDRVSWRPIWGGRGDAVREPMTMLLDHLYVSGRR